MLRRGILSARDVTLVRYARCMTDTAVQIAGQGTPLRGASETRCTRSAKVNWNLRRGDSHPIIATGEPMQIS